MNLPSCISSKEIHCSSLKCQDCKYLKTLIKGLFHVDGQRKWGKQPSRNTKPEKKIVIVNSPNFLQKSWSTVFLSSVILASHSSFTVFESDTEQNNIPYHFGCIFSRSAYSMHNHPAFPGNTENTMWKKYGFNLELGKPGLCFSSHSWSKSLLLDWLVLEPVSVFSGH